MATLANLQDEGAPGAATPNAGMDDAQQPSHTEQDPTDGGDPKQMIGWVPSGFPAKLRVYLKMARAALISPMGSAMLKKCLQAGDHVKGLAYLIAKTMQQLEQKFGPLQDQEYDKVAMVIAGWLVSSLQEMGMPGLDDAGARQDLMGRILQQLDALTGHGGQGGAQGAQPQGGQPAPGQTPGVGAPESGTMPQMGGM